MAKVTKASTTKVSKTKPATTVVASKVTKSKKDIKQSVTATSSKLPQSTKVKPDKNQPKLLNSIVAPNNTSGFNPARFNIILGVLIILVSAVLVFSFLAKQNTPVNNSAEPSIITAKQDNKNSDQKYTVQDGDTLFLIAQKYYGNGYDFQKIADQNKLADPNTIQVGQVLDIPKLTPAEISQASASATPSSTPQANAAQIDQKPSIQPAAPTVSQTSNNWGDKISGAKYTVQVGDWLSKIAGRAYGDIYAYTKIAEANHLTDPDNIEPGTVLIIPR